MKTYRVTRKSDGALVYRYQAEAPIEWSGMGFVDHDHIEELQETAPEADTRMFGGRRQLTKLEFLELLGADLTSILAAAKQSIDVEAFVLMVTLATPDANGCAIDLDDPRMAALHQLEQSGVISAGRAEIILNG